MEKVGWVYFIDRAFQFLPSCEINTFMLERTFIKDP